MKQERKSLVSKSPEENKKGYQFMPCHKVVPVVPVQQTKEEDNSKPSDVGGPGRKKKLAIKEKRRKHREELMNYIESVDEHSNEDKPSTESDEVESEVERMLSRCRRGFGVTGFIRSVNFLIFVWL